MGEPSMVTGGAPATLTVTVDAVHQCPYKHERDEGTLTVTYRSASETIELHSLREWVDGLSDWEVSHEAFTAHVRSKLAELVHVVEVSSSWTTAGMAVRVTA